ncbi:MAG: hypothetical protein JWM80_2861 [Cyanobacteria bacterium RYN_339]|nr:hypothetical protein [Cyanobacteria bacterium RYN_339]
MLSQVLNAMRPLVIPAVIPAAPPTPARIDPPKDRPRSGADQLMLSGNIATGSMVQVKPHHKHHPKTVEYTTKFDHTVAELAQQLGVDEAALRKANGWPEGGNPVIAAGTKLHVPDTEGSRAAIAQLNAGNGVPTATAAPAAQDAGASAGTAGATRTPGGKGAVADPDRVHYISQYHPDGEDATYDADTTTSDGIAGGSQCGATSLAMVARLQGYGSDETDAQLIETMGGLAGTDRDAGTSAQGIYQAAQAAGWSAEAPVYDAADQQAAIDAALQSGQVLVANGNYYAMYGLDGISGHFIVVTGMTADGNYIIQDPAKDVGGEGQVVTWEQLQAFFATHDGGDRGNYVAITPAA